MCYEESEGEQVNEQDAQASLNFGIFSGDPDAPYLGDRKVVWAVLQGLLNAVIENPAEFEASLREATDILTGRDPGYRPIGPWNEGGIGNWIRGNMNGVPGGDAAQAVEYALAHLVLHLFDAIKAVELGDLTHEQAGKRMRRFVSNWTNLMLGIPFPMYAAMAKADGVEDR